ncbi:NADH-quinone oxidoreductase subunit A [Shewanella surugensis]|uniref:NADH-quinone oxidoreductase subunit n=1 Tax=Shewanella surugensis TaxID=212020 RepID=A0ABT0L9D6_9GAMM|nr:NADH-quinone oxidoreductase subunit A [Shewanella surugensis]MCL1124095.1 NADH-quinone oxidoreductase subunit A [Shewanella surugensis]
MTHSTPEIFLLIFAIVAMAIAILLLSLNRLIAGKPLPREQEVPFECGLNPTTSPSKSLSINYFLVASAFLIFELETAILWPWAVNYWELGMGGMISAVSFMIILLLGLFYLLAKRALSI